MYTLPGCVQGLIENATQMNSRIGPLRKEEEMTNNQTAFDELLKFSVDVDLPVSGVKLACRRVPFTTVTHIISTLATTSRIGLIQSRSALLETLGTLGKGETSNVEVASNVLAMAAPLLIDVIVTAPELCERVLADVIVGATQEVVRVLPPEDVLHILNEIFALLDVGLLAKELDRSFFGLRALVEAMNNLLPKKKEDSANTESDKSAS